MTWIVSRLFFLEHFSTQRTYTLKHQMSWILKIFHHFWKHEHPTVIHNRLHFLDTIFVLFQVPKMSSFHCSIFEENWLIFFEEIAQETHCFSFLDQCRWTLTWRVVDHWSSQVWRAFLADLSEFRGECPMLGLLWRSCTQNQSNFHPTLCNSLKVWHIFKIDTSTFLQHFLDRVVFTSKSRNPNIRTRLLSCTFFDVFWAIQVFPIVNCHYMRKIHV